MPEEELQKIIEQLKKEGVEVIIDDTTEVYLKHMNAGGSTEKGQIIFRKNPDRATVYEEMIHARQYNKNLPFVTPADRCKREIEACEELLANKEKW